jgi:uncharacterized membrane protein
VGRSTYTGGQPRRKVGVENGHVVARKGGQFMMYGSGFGWGWMWFAGVMLLLILAALIILIVRAWTAGSSSRGGQSPLTNTARQIAEERLARGEITADEFRQVARALEERT